MVAAELLYGFITLSFLIDECVISEFFSDFIISLVKQFLSTVPDMKLVDEELHAVQVWKKASLTLWLIDPNQVQELMLLKWV